MRQQIGLDTGLSDMAQQDVPQRDGKLTDYREARRRAWMEEYREERREEGRQEGLQVTRHLLTRQAALRFDPQIGQRLAKEVADVDDVARFEQIGVLILDSADGNELLRRLDAKRRYSVLLREPN